VSSLLHYFASDRYIAHCPLGRTPTT
jgi:hypothetical protein